MIEDFRLQIVKGGSDSADAMKKRTKQFALRVIKLFHALPRKAEAEIIGKQLLRSATSVGANYRAACRARSRADFVSKLGIVLEEMDESTFWLELIIESGLLPARRMEPIQREANELTAIFVSSVRTAKGQV